MAGTTQKRRNSRERGSKKREVETESDKGKEVELDGENGNINKENNGKQQKVAAITIKSSNYIFFVWYCC